MTSTTCRTSTPSPTSPKTCWRRWRDGPCAAGVFARRPAHSLLMTRILGIDPGSRVTGYGIIELQGRESRYVASGCERMEQEEFPARQRAIVDALSRLVAEYQPNEVAIEKVFVQRNVDSALKLGQALGEFFLL